LVLVAGGSDFYGNPLASAELFDVAQPFVHRAGDMLTPRAYARAARLNDGRVLMVGGRTSELYDPRTETWSATGNLHVQRGRFDAALLADGRVLVAGDAIGGHQPCEIYNPASGAWSTTTAMQMDRELPSLAPLLDGRVLAIDGATNMGTVEVYDPQTGQWTYTGSLTVDRADFSTARLHDGRVLVIGGRANGVEKSVEIYDPRAGTWSFTGSMTTTRVRPPAVTLPSGEVLVAGGGPEDSDSATAELYDPVSGNWTRTADPPFGHLQATSIVSLANGDVLLAGGSSFQQHVGLIPTASMAVYDPKRSVWAFAASLSQARYAQTATLLTNGDVLFAGGFVDLVSITASSELFHWPAPYEWPTPMMTVTVAPINHNGRVTSSPPGMACSQPHNGVCSHQFPAGSSVTLTADSPAGNEFAGWGYDCASAQQNLTCTLQLDSDKSVSASFHND
jgi:hypothetical protein